MGVDLDFVALCDAHYDEVARYVKRHRLSPSTADDLVHETFLEARESRATYDPARATLRAWLFGIALNVIRGHFRETKARTKAHELAAAREIVYDDDVERLIAKLDARAQRRVLDQALRSLRREHREALALWAWTDLTQPEIAAVLGRPPGTIKTHLYAARAQMIAALKLSLERTDG
jgi:RNA polymerase sigma-70 factor, ECF subfamily